MSWKAVGSVKDPGGSWREAAVVWACASAVAGASRACRRSLSSATTASWYRASRLSMAWRSTRGLGALGAVAWPWSPPDVQPARSRSSARTQSSQGEYDTTSTTPDVLYKHPRHYGCDLCTFAGLLKPGSCPTHKGLLCSGFQGTLQAQVLSEESTGSRGALPAAFCILSGGKDARITNLNSKAGQIAEII